MKKFIYIAVLLIVIGGLMVPVFANTDGSELQVLQAENLEIQLGTSWSGTEFQLKTDAGVYPDALVVGEDGILRTEIGGSTTYILTCINAPMAVAAQTSQTSQIPESLQEMSDAGNVPEVESVKDISDDHSETVLIQIPVRNVVWFVVGLLLAIGGLIGLSIAKRLTSGDSSDDEDEDDL